MKPVLAIGSVTLLDLDRPLTMYYVVLACLAGVFAKLALIARSRFGRALAGIKANEQRMRAAGFSTYPYKLAAFVASGAIAGLGGFLFAVKDGFVNPELLSWHLSGAVLIMIILGGLGHLRGAVLGAFAFALLQEFFKSEAIFGAFAKHWLLGLGLTIIVSVALVAARPHRRGRLVASRAAPPVEAHMSAAPGHPEAARAPRAARAKGAHMSEPCCAHAISHAASAAWWRWTACRSNCTAAACMR